MSDYLEIFNSSFERVLPAICGDDEFLEVFYNLFFHSSNKIADKFRHTDMEKQKRILRNSLSDVIGVFVYRHETDYLKTLATFHDRKHLDIPPDMYDLWLQALVKAVEQCDPEFESNTALAWKLVLSPGISYMKHHY